ncbi:MAG TPA: hypothetical protein VHK91_08655, partial [Flavisolibacter sp.]|nr:hypothetical protein [Flavisolibacter sp.]
MKSFLLISLFIVSATCSRAQDAQVNTLPSGKYETIIKSSQNKWEKGDIVLLDNNKYRISSTTETGEYRFSSTAQRVFFTSGPLKGIFAKTQMNNSVPVIYIPQ